EADQLGPCSESHLCLPFFDEGSDVRRGRGARGAVELCGQCRYGTFETRWSPTESPESPFTPCARPPRVVAAGRPATPLPLAVLGPVSGNAEKSVKGVTFPH